MPLDTPDNVGLVELSRDDPILGSLLAFYFESIEGVVGMEEQLTKSRLDSRSVETIVSERRKALGSIFLACWCVLRLEQTLLRGDEVVVLAENNGELR